MRESNKGGGDPRAFFERPVLNSPYASPAQHWELDGKGRPTHKVLDSRRPVSFINPIPKPRKRSGRPTDPLPQINNTLGAADEAQAEAARIINEIRAHLAKWREASPATWGVTPETARLLQHWRSYPFNQARPFFCQLEAIETLIWLTEVAPKAASTQKYLDYLATANQDNPELSRLALKLATGAGKTTVMAMTIAWQTINAVRYPGSKQFTNAFLIVTPGITIKDRLRVLEPNHDDSYYHQRELVPHDLRVDMLRARVVITNYHAFLLRQRGELSKGGRQLLQGRTGEAIDTTETEAQMLHRVMPGLMGVPQVMVLNDEAHHCYREKPDSPNDDAAEVALSTDDKKEAEENQKAARAWLGGLEAVNRVLKVTRVVDLSATPFYLRGSGYPEGTLFPWTMSDFSLMDAIECGIVKLPRVPVAENIPGTGMPTFRNLWEHIRDEMPKKTKGLQDLDPHKLPTLFFSALDNLYSHYEKTYQQWVAAGIKVPPCFIVVCNNTATSKLVYDYIAGYHRELKNGGSEFKPSRHSLFANYNEETGDAYPTPRTLLIDSKQLESNEPLGTDFRKLAADEIAQFKAEFLARTNDHKAAENLSDAALLREVMNTVGREGKLGEQIRCVVSVSMLTEGWDANNVTHILGVRAFSTQLLCEQVIGRALRRQSYELNAETQRFNVEYADVFGIPFDFAAEAVIAPPQPPNMAVAVRAVRPERDSLEIRFPRVIGYRTVIPPEGLEASFNEDSTLELTPALLGPTITRNEGLIGSGADIQATHLNAVRPATLVYHFTNHLLEKYRDPNEGKPLHLFGPLRRIAKQWIDNHLKCEGGTYPAQLMYRQVAEIACDRILAGIHKAQQAERTVEVLLDAYNQVGSTAEVRFTTAKPDRWETKPDRCHVNLVVLDSDWEAELCRVVEAHPRVAAYVKNHGLGFTVPYQAGDTQHSYLPDFIVLIDDGLGPDNLLHLVIEVKGYRNEDAKTKKQTMETYWIPGVNHHGGFGRWAFLELTNIYTMADKVAAEINQQLDRAAGLALPTSQRSARRK